MISKVNIKFFFRPLVLWVLTRDLSFSHLEFGICTLRHNQRATNSKLPVKNISPRPTSPKLTAALLESWLIPLENTTLKSKCSFLPVSSFIFVNFSFCSEWATQTSGEIFLLHADGTSFVDSESETQSEEEEEEANNNADHGLDGGRLLLPFEFTNRTGGFYVAQDKFLGINKVKDQQCTHFSYPLPSPLCPTYSDLFFSVSQLLTNGFYSREMLLFSMFILMIK